MGRQALQVLQVLLVVWDQQDPLVVLAPLVLLAPRVPLVRQVKMVKAKRRNQTTKGVLVQTQVERLAPVVLPVQSVA